MAVRSLRRSTLHIALLGAASIASLAWAGEAAAQCVTSPAQPLNAIATDSTVVSCTGSVSGPTITVNANGTNVDSNGPGTNVTGANITVTGNSNVVQVRNGAILNGSQIALTGTGNTVLYGGGAISNGSIVNISGANSQLLFLSGSQVTQNPGQTTISALAGEQNNIVIFAGGGLFTTGGNGQYLLTGGTGNQNVVIDGFLVAPSDGLAIALGDGDDSIAIGGAANISTQASGIALFDGGAGTDTFSINDDGMWIHDTIGFEVININPNTAITLTGSNADAVRFNVQGGSVTVTDSAVLGVANSTVDIGQFGELTLAYSASASFGNTLTGSGRLNVDSAGNTISFSGDGSGYTGTLVIGAGTTAALGQAGAVGAGSIVNNGTIAWGDFNLANSIAGSGGLIYTGIGTGDLSGANSFSGGIDIRSGSLRVTSVGALGLGTITSTTGGVILQMDNSSYQALANDLTGALVLAKTSGGVLELTGTNSYTGGTLIDTGAIRVDSFARLGTGQVIANAGGSLILNYAGAGQLLQTTPFLSGAGSFIKEGNGDMVISVANSYTGGTIIREGRLGLNNGDALGTGTIQIDAGAELGIGGIILNNNLTGSGLVRKTANNTVELYGNNSGFTGTLQIADGDVLVTNGNALGSGILQIDTGASVFVNAVTDSTLAAGLTGAGTFEKAGGGRLTLTGNGTQFGGAIAIQNGTLQIAGDQNVGTSPGGIFINAAGTLALDTAANSMLATVVYGSGNVVKTGSGTVFMTGANTYSGGTDIQQGAIRVTDVSVLGTGAITVQQGAALDLSIAGAQTLNQNVTGAGILRKSDTGDLTLLGNGLTGGVDIAGGRVIVGTAAALGGGNVTTAADTQLVFANSTTEGISTVISGAGGLTKDGSGLLAVNNNNSYTGGTLVNSGRLVANSSGAFGTGTVTILAGAEVGIGGVTLANTISGAGRVIKTANNSGMLTGTNSYSGGTDIQQGTLIVTNPAALGSGAVSIASGAFLNVDYSGSSNVALNTMLTGAGAFIKDGSGTLVMNAFGNSYSGGTAINGGTLGLNFGDALGTGNVVINAGATLALGDVTYANTTSGVGQIVKASAGVTTITGTNSHSGGVNIQTGILDVTGSGALGSGTVTIGSGANLRYTNSAAATFGNALAGTGTFNKLGTGLLSFANNFTIGALSLQAGRTRINTVATTNVSVAPGATLDGTGRIIGTLTNNGTVAPGNSIGTLTVEGNYIHNSGSVLEIEFDGAGNIDLLSVTGTAALNGGTLRFVSLGGAEGTGGTFLTATGGITGTFATVETVGAQLPLAVIYETNRALMAPSVLTARPSTFNAQSLAAAETGFAFIGTLADQPVSARTGRRLWMDGFGSWNSRSASGTTLGYSHDSYGLAGGMTFPIDERVSVGGSIGWSSGDISLSSNGGGGEQDVLLGSLHARYQESNGFAVTAGLVYGGIDQTTVRNVSFNGFAATVNGSTDSTLFGGFAAASLPLIEGPQWHFGSDLRGSIIRQSQDGYTEGGTSPLRLRVADIDTTTFEASGRLFAETRLIDRTNSGEETQEALTLRFDLGARYLNLAGDRRIPVTFAASNAGVVLDGDGRDGTHVVGGVALSYTTRGGLTARIGYEGEAGRSDRHSVRLGLSMRF